MGLDVIKTSYLRQLGTFLGEFGCFLAEIPLFGLTRVRNGRHCLIFQFAKKLFSARLFTRKLGVLKLHSIQEQLDFDLFRQLKDFHIRKLCINRLTSDIKPSNIVLPRSYVARENEISRV